jgi:hypothetical protein
VFSTLRFTNAPNPTWLLESNMRQKTVSFIRRLHTQCSGNNITAPVANSHIAVSPSFVDEGASATQTAAVASVCDTMRLSQAKPAP